MKSEIAASSTGHALTRRNFIATTGLGLSALAAGILARPSVGQGTDARLKLGFDNFSVRAMGWKAPALLDYAASLKLDLLFISDLDSYDSLEDKPLQEVRAKAADLGVQMYAGTWSICPSAKAFKTKWGTAEEHLRLGLRVAKALGSPIIRCVMGTGEDRKSAGGVEARMAETVKVLKACRSQAMDSGIKIAIENHAGDMQAREVIRLVEEAGKDFMGVTMDAGNATWTMEDPMLNLELLGPYALCTGLRDSMVWEYAEGAKVQWTALGEGLVDWNAYFKRFKELCPQTPVVLEIISGFAKPIPYLQPQFWDYYPKASAADFARFLAMAKKGHELASHKSADKAEEQAYQKAELERSLQYCRKLGIGLKG